MEHSQRDGTGMDEFPRLQPGYFGKIHKQPRLSEKPLQIGYFSLYDENTGRLKPSSNDTLPAMRDVLNGHQ